MVGSIERRSAVVRGEPIRRLGYRPGLDGVRALAIVAVMGFHTDARLVRGGYLGVDVFLVLSAFLISSLILEEVVDRGGGYGFAAFYARRARRLGPALLIWLVLLAAPAAMLAGQGGRIFPSSFATLLYFGDLAVAGIVHVPMANAYLHVWSLAIEEQFYAVWPVVLVFLVLPRRAPVRRSALVAFVLAAPILHLASGAFVANTYYLPTGHLTPIAMGCLAADLFAFGVPVVVGRIADSTVVAAGSVGVIASMFIGFDNDNILPLVVAGTVTAVASGVLILHLVVAQDSRVGALLSLPLVVWVGRRSYGLYLYHRTIAILIPLLWPGISGRYAGPCGVIASLILAGLSYRFIEYPIIAAGHRHHRRPRPQMPA